MRQISESLGTIQNQQVEIMDKMTDLQNTLTRIGMRIQELETEFVEVQQVNAQQMQSVKNPYANNQVQE